ncbi:MAG: glycosyltransferase family 2 protein [Nitrospirae bacterium]|nr:glycosyltransferase family 2 protein [Nitrospirota bacterium]
MKSIRKNDFAVLIPAYNEADRIADTIAGIREHCSAEIVVISDGSSDSTVEKVSETGSVVIALPFNLGYGAALQTGYQYALLHGYDFAIQMDADGQHDPAFIPGIIRKVQTGMADVAIGSRFLGEGVYNLSFTRKTGVLFFSSLASVLTRQKVTDPTSGFQALNRKAMEFYASEAYPVDFPDADVLIMLHRQGLRFVEVPVKMNPNTKKKTMHSGLVPVYYLFKMMLSIVVTLLRKYEFRRES